MPSSEKTPILLVDDETGVYWHGRRYGRLASNIRTSYDSTFDGVDLLHLSFTVANWPEESPPPPKPKRTWAKHMGLRRPT